MEVARCWSTLNSKWFLPWDLFLRILLAYEFPFRFYLEKLLTQPYFNLIRFATVDIMHQYGLLLENFSENGEFVNDCIFTMMHHIGGDLGHVAILFQPSILKTFSLIWETEYEICDVSLNNTFGISKKIYRFVFLFYRTGLI